MIHSEEYISKSIFLYKIADIGYRVYSIDDNILSNRDLRERERERGRERVCVCLITYSSRIHVS